MAPYIRSVAKAGNCSDATAAPTVDQPHLGRSPKTVAYLAIAVGTPITGRPPLPGGALPPYRGRSFTGRIAPASPDAPELKVRIHLPPAESPRRGNEEEAA